MHQFKTEQFLLIDKYQAWDFFSSPNNLSLITPPGMDFKIMGSFKNNHIFEGMKIDYTVKPLFGIKVRWQTEITKVDYLKSFTDTQAKGPYKSWVHTHVFTEAGGGILMTDIVNYQVPLGFVGNFINAILIRKKIGHIFNYRRSVLASLFS